MFVVCIVTSARGCLSASLGDCLLPSSGCVSIVLNVLIYSCFGVVDQFLGSLKLHIQSDSCNIQIIHSAH